MKNINEILNHITNNPSYDKLNIFLEIKRFVNILPLKLKSGIKFVYIKNQTMHFVLTHQLFKVEFEHNKDTLKALLKMADIKDVSNFVFFVSNSVDNLIKKNSKNKDKKYIKKNMVIRKKSVGIFENRAKDEKIFKKFESIREIIKNSTNQSSI